MIRKKKAMKIVAKKRVTILAQRLTLISGREVGQLLHNEAGKSKFCTHAVHWGISWYTTLPNLDNDYKCNRPEKVMVTRGSDP